MKFTFRNSWLARSPDLWPVWAAAAFAVLLVWVLPAAAGAQQPTTPERPTGLHATEIAHNSVSLAWDDPSDGSVTGYRILRRDRDNDAPGVFTTIEADTGSSAASHVDATAQAQRRYVYRVVARNAAGDSPRSSYVNVETPAAPLPARPTGLQATEVAHDSVSLEWADPGDDSITGYQVLRRARDGDEYGDGEGAAAFVAVVDNTGTAATSYTDTTVTARTRYVYQVQAINSQGTSPRSFHLNVETPYAVPDSPTGLAAWPSGPTSVLLSWADPGDESIAGYQVLRRSRDGDQYGDNQGEAAFSPVAANTGNAVAFYSDTSLKPRTRYVYQVKAINSAGKSEASASVDVETPEMPTVPDQPSNLRASTVTHESVTLDWIDPRDDSITGYQVLRRSRDGDQYGDAQGDAAFLPIAADTGNPATSYADTSVSPRTRYVYRIRAINSHGMSERSRFLNVDTPEEPTVPDRPAGLRASTVHNNRVTLRWIDPRDDSITGYQVLRRSRDGDQYGDGQGDAAFLPIAADTGNPATSYTDASVAPGTRYAYRVTVINAIGVSQPSTELNVETPTAPPKPTGLTTGLVTYERVVLAWDDPGLSAITGYRVLRREGDSGPFTTIRNDSESPSTSYTDRTALADTSYEYRVVALTDTGPSPESDSLGVRTLPFSGTSSACFPRTTSLGFPPGRTWT